MGSDGLDSCKFNNSIADKITDAFLLSIYYLGTFMLFVSGVAAFTKPTNGQLLLMSIPFLVSLSFRLGVGVFLRKVDFAFFRPFKTKIRHLFGGQLTVEEIQWFHKKEYQKRRKALLKNKEEIESLFELVSGLNEEWQRSIKEKKEGFGNELALAEKTKVGVDARKEELAQVLISLTAQLKESDEKAGQLEVLLQRHQLYKKTVEIMRTTEFGLVAKTNAEANLAAAWEITRSISDLLTQSEIAAGVYTGVPTEELVANILRRQGIEPVPESATEIIRAAEKILS